MSQSNQRDGLCGTNVCNMIDLALATRHGGEPHGWLWSAVRDMTGWIQSWVVCIFWLSLNRELLESNSKDYTHTWPETYRILV